MNKIMKYIDAEKLTKAIEDKGLDCSFALKMERLDILALIDSLQQEQPEVDLNAEIEKELRLHYNDDQDVYWWNYLKNSFYHFYELGLKAK